MPRSLTLLLLFLSLTLQISTTSAQTKPSYKVEYGKALEAYESGDKEAYRLHMEATYATLPPKGTTPIDDINRPFLLYHLARARALMGESEGTVAILQQLLDEDIEALIVSQAGFDTAFDTLRGDRDFKKMMRRLKKHPLQVEPVGPDLHLIQGAGAAILALTTAEGTLLVDTGYAPAAKGIERAVTKLGGGDIRYIINTHLHSDHVGGNAALGGDATIIAHPLTRKGMMDPEPFIDQPSPKPPMAALPAVMSAYPMTLRLGDEEVQITPLPGHTEGDVMVYFARARVLHIGDRYFPSKGQVTWMFPGPDFWGHMAVMDALVKGLPDDGLLIPGHGAPVPLLHLKRSHQAMRGAVDYVAEAINDGLSLEEIGEEGLPTEWTEWSRGREAQWLAFFYEQLTLGSDTPE